MKNLTRWKIIFLAVYLVFVAASFFTGWPIGKSMGQNLWSFARSMLLILPPAFILIGLFDVWVDRRLVEKGLGKTSGKMGYMWALLLAGTMSGGSYAAFPVANSLYRKGASFNIILTYVGASAIVRIPMTVFEASFLGVKFTVVRFLVSLSLLIFSSAVIGGYLEKIGYKLPDPGTEERA